MAITETHNSCKIRVRAGKRAGWGTMFATLNGEPISTAEKFDESKAVAEIVGLLNHIHSQPIDASYPAHYYKPGTYDLCQYGHAVAPGGTCQHVYCQKEAAANAPTLNDFELDECDGADRPADDQEPTLLGLIMQYRDARVADADALLERIRAALDAVPLGEVSPVTLEPIPATCASRIPGRTDDQCTHDALLVIAARGPVATESLPAGLVGRLVGAGLAEGTDLTGAHLVLTDAGQRAAGAERARMAVAVG